MKHGRQTRQIDGSGRVKMDAGRLRTRRHIDVGHRPEVLVGGTTYRPLDIADPRASAAGPNGAYSGTSGDSLRGHVSRHHTVV
jgi:hypothetical protein